jgi:predicted AAA+ superfamily ATPase
MELIKNKSFGGRGDQVQVFPLSFKEYYDFVGGDKSEVYELYALYGGMPQLLSFKRDEEKVKYLKNLFSEVYFKDISERYIVKNIKASTSTIAKYLEYLIESFMFSEAKRYDVKGKKYFEYPLKYYCTDVGLRNARLNFRQQEETHIMENIIYNELIIRGYSVDVGVVEIIENAEGKKRRKQCEIDFVVNMGARRYYIQSALSVSDPDKMTTELRPLKKTKDFFKKIIISKSNAKPWIDEDGIVHIGLYDFLLNQNSLEL